MKPEQFIRDWGLPEAKRLINESPEWASEWCMDCKDYINYCDSDVVSDCESCVSIAGLERLVESLDLFKELKTKKNANREFMKACMRGQTERANQIKRAMEAQDAVFGIKGASHE